MQSMNRFKQEKRYNDIASASLGSTAMDFNDKSVGLWYGKVDNSENSVILSEAYLRI